MLVFGGTYTLVQKFVPVNKIINGRRFFVKMAEYTQFGLAVKTKLMGPPRRTQAWLVEEVKATTGLYFDDA